MNILDENEWLKISAKADTWMFAAAQDAHLISCKHLKQPWDSRACFAMREIVAKLVEIRDRDKENDRE